ncbi:cell division site-positioning protein MapZ family protein [Lactococcus ileimucosae]|uniref:Cell division site-positioning protein MapZ family protein n=1 Tax=Lactococcus ileimucosae TaxID=2941329 RepID=A0ABV4D328_9LACT
MTEEKDKDIKNSGEKVLKLGDVSDFTVGEIVKKAERVDKENSESESVLDKYIRQHRGEIEAVKNQALEKYIQAERKKMSQEDTADLNDEASDAKKEPEELSRETEESSEERITEAVASPEKEGVPAESYPEDLNSKEKTSEFDEVEVVDDLPPVLPVSDDKLEAEKGTEGMMKGDSSEHSTPTLAEEESSAELSESSRKAINEASRDAVPETEKVRPVEQGSVVGEPLPNPTPVVTESEPAGSTKDTPEKKNNKKPLIIGLCAFVLLAAGGAGYALYNHNNNQKAAEQAAAVNKENLTAFNKAYDEFFTDSDHLLLKNANFDQLENLKEKLSKLKGQEFEAAEKKVNELEAQITAVEKVNALFNKPVVVDGKLDETAQVKTAVALPAVPKTANESLNEVLEKAINLAKKQQAEAKAKEEQAAAAAQNNRNAAVAGQAAENSNSAVTEPANGSANAPTRQTENQGTQSSAPAGGVMPNGAQNPTGATPDNSNARVQPQPNLNPNDPAFTWNPGIKDKVLNIARQRGYISGNNFILLPVAIHTMTSGFMAGQVAGYYNLYRPDGSYLLTINAKTGYFFGNGKGLPTDFG